MAEPLKNQYGEEIPRKIAGMISAVDENFPAKQFLAEVLEGYESLELMPRARHIARALRGSLPHEYSKAVATLVASLGPKLDRTENNGMAPFLYLPHVFFVADYGLHDFELSMQAQYELTQRFTAEFSIRPYLMLYPEQTLARLQTWATDSSVHVRRLVSEGTRPRLPWAPRLRSFQENPQPVLALLELLKDDPELYVRRSVANNLNDIGKDNPDVLIETTQRWLQNATPERRWLVTHALRSALKRGDANALKVMGFGTQSHIEVCHVVIAPQHVYTGESVKIRFDVVNAGTETQRLLIDLGVYFVKRHGGDQRKVFKLKTVELAAAESIRLAKTISLQEMTTRTHYAGVHRVEAIVNGEPTPLGQFVLAER